MARTYNAAQIAIIRSKAAKKAGAVAAPTQRPAVEAVRNGARPWKARAPKKTFTIQPVQASEELGCTITVNYVSEERYGAPTVKRFNTTGEIMEAYGLTDIRGLRNDLLENTKDGEVFATLDPYEMEIYERRSLLVAGGAKELKYEYDTSCVSI